jgi:uncharacterized repeat protein (TIGR02543 family)
MVVTSNGRIFQIGTPPRFDIQIESILTSQHKVPFEITTEFPISSNEKITQLSLGSTHFAAITSNMDAIYTWGNSEFNKLGQTDKYTDPKLYSGLYRNTAWQPPQMIIGSKILDSITEIVNYKFDDQLQNLSGVNREGFTFDAWYTDESFTELFDLEDMPSRDLKVFGRWFVSE